MKTRSKENLTRLDDILRRLKPSEFKDNHLAAYKVKLPRSVKTKLSKLTDALQTESAQKLLEKIILQHTR